jgi:hypothetical protein
MIWMNTPPSSSWPKSKPSKKQEANRALCTSIRLLYFQKIEFFILTAVTISNPTGKTYFSCHTAYFSGFFNP